MRELRRWSSDMRPAGPPSRYRQVVHVRAGLRRLLARLRPPQSSFPVRASIREVPVAARVLVVSVALAAAAVTAAVALLYPPAFAAWLPVPPLLVGYLVAPHGRHVPLADRRGANRRAAGASTTLRTVFIGAALVMCAPLPAVAVALLVTGHEEWWTQRISPVKVLYNTAAATLAAAVTVLASAALAGPRPVRFGGLEPATARAAAAVLVTPVLFHLLCTVLVALVIKLVVGVRLRDGGLLGWDHAVTEVHLLGLGALGAVAWVSFPTLVLLVAVPLLMVRRATEFRQVRLAAMTDPKTGLLNFAAFSSAADELVAEHLRTGQPLSALVCDLDHLRDVNNAHGHFAGDLVIDALARQLREHTRPEDLACRFGGEEFMVVLPGTGVEGARVIAERIRSALGAQVLVAVTARLYPSVSIGVSTLGDGVESLDALLMAADRAVYLAKAAGRNCVAAAAADGLTG